MIYDVIIVGCGAAGVAAAIELKNKSDLSVAAIEQNDKVLKKVLKTGNGKCNIFNRDINSDKYNDFSLIDNDINLDLFFKELGLVLKTDDNGRVYPYSESSNNVVNILINKLNKSDIDLYTNYNVIKINQKDDIFEIVSEEKNIVLGRNIIFSTGSLSQEKTNGYDVLKRLGHNVTSLKPGLVSLVTKEKTSHLKGLRVKCLCKIRDKNIKGELLFKDNGLSGIISFDLSRLVNNGDVVFFDLVPELSALELREHFERNESYESAMLGLFPKMIGFDILKRCDNNLDKIINEIKNYSFTIISRAGYEQSQITLGGIKLDEINKDFSSKIIKNLYVCGEILNVDGACGGYNLYFAWMSGIKAARSIMAKYR